MTYDIVRHYRDGRRKPDIIRRGVTLEEAQRHCQDPETSSRTAKSDHARQLTETVGDWFDGYRRA